MSRWFTLGLFLVAAFLGHGISAQQTGSEPPASFGARNVFDDFHLPRFHNDRGNALWQGQQNLQLIQRATHLKLTAESATNAWYLGERTYRHARETLQAAPPENQVIFNGQLTSKLNALLDQQKNKAVKVTSAELKVDAPIRLSSGQSLDLGHAKLKSTDAIRYSILIENAQNVTLSGGDLQSGHWGVLVLKSHNIAISGLVLQNLDGGGITVDSSTDVTLWRNHLHGLHAAPVLLIGDTHRTAVIENEIDHNLGSSNWHASILISDRNVDFSTTFSEFSGNPHFFQPMLQRPRIPHDNVIAYNHIYGNLSSGIYSDGSIRNVIAGNLIEGNSKEGLCLDDGSIADVVTGNTFRENGKRWGKSDLALQQDFVFNLGRLEDGTSPSKLPGISLDNAAYNLVLYNNVNQNYGGGIKMVRTGLYNVLGLNLLLDDNKGQNKNFHFFGIELGSTRLDGPSVELDGTASQGNIVFANTIRGTHYTGIFFADDSTGNQVIDNSIFGATNWALESTRRQPNFTLNNISNEPSRNINPGLDPNLGQLSAGHFDH